MLCFCFSIVPTESGKCQGCVFGKKKSLQQVKKSSVQVPTIPRDTGYPHDSRADKDSYPHDGHADKDSNPHDGRAD